MLSSLKIENIAIIERADIDFENGLNVLSGETGAGKSIIIDALSAVLGERTSKELIRTGAERASIAAVFENVPKRIDLLLESLGLPECDGGQLLITRVINLDGRNVCKVNQSPVTVSILKQIGRELISIHGQHDSQNLLNPECHYRYLDSLGGLESLLSTYQEEYNGYTELYRQYKTLTGNEEERNKRIEYLRFVVDELETAAIRVGEYNELCDRREMFRNSEKVLGGLREALSIIADNDDTNGALTALFDAAKSVERSAAYYDEISPLATSLLDLCYSLNDKKDQLEKACQDCEFDPSKLEVIEDRISLIYDLKVKYGETEEEILDFLQKAKEELSTLLNYDASSDALVAELETRRERLLGAAQKLSDARKHAASEFEVRVQNELSFLDMPNVEISTSFETCKLNPTGADVIEFLISPNVGEDLKPLAKIASGGELSRIMLAIQNVLASKENTDTMIFDEIDTGVSGSAAEKIAISLKKVARNCQVICITHSAQVAAYADTHFLISKAVQNGKTYTSVNALDLDGRVEEVARIIGGVNVTELQRDNAKEMIENAKGSIR